MTTDNCCFYLQNRLIQTGQIGGQQYSDTFPFSVPCLYYKHIIIINDDSRVVSKRHSKLWRHFLATLEVSFRLLESSIMLLVNIYSTGITHDNCHLRLSYFYSTGHSLFSPEHQRRLKKKFYNIFIAACFSSA
jgi:hypothetical protein